jgi:hypothetical protein
LKYPHFVAPKYTGIYKQFPESPTRSEQGNWVETSAGKHQVFGHVKGIEQQPN